MKIFKPFLIFLVIISACKKDKDNEAEVNLPKDYGKGMYILTDQGVSFYNIEDADSLRVVKNNIYSADNGVYITDLSINPSLHISNIDANCITVNTEQINDSTWAEYLYINDANQSGKVLKYEAWSGVPVDTITVSGNILEVAFY